MLNQEALNNLKLHLTSPRKRADHTIYSYQLVASKFLSFCGNKTPDSNDVRRYLLNIPSSSYARYIYYCLRKLFKANGWNFDIEEVPEVGKQNTPTMSIDEVAQLIKTRSLLSSDERAFLALSTTYGLRRIELCSVRKEDIGGKLHIEARKRGEARDHLIPEEIRPYLEDWEWLPVAESTASIMFNRICCKAGVESDRLEGWHGIRRSLATYLEANAPIMMVWDYLRWSKPAGAKGYGISSMLGTYFHMEPDEVDRQIFLVQPWLKYWE